MKGKLKLSKLNAHLGESHLSKQSRQERGFPATDASADSNQWTLERLKKPTVALWDLMMKQAKVC